jgi:glyoxylase I family protein
VVVVNDIQKSLEFYHEGIGLDILSDHIVEGDWPHLLGGKANSLRAVFLGDNRVPDLSAGVLELNAFENRVPDGQTLTAPTAGLFLLSFFVSDVDATLKRLSQLGLGGEPRRIEQPSPNGPLHLATVHDPDGTLILLTPGSITQATPGSAERTTSNPR